MRYPHPTPPLRASLWRQSHGPSLTTPHDHTHVDLSQDDRSPSDRPRHRRAGRLQKVTVLAHDSFVIDKAQIAAFEKATGCTVTLAAQGDAGELTNKLILTKNSPLGDVAFGVDNTYAGRAVSEGVFESWLPTLPAGADTKLLAGAGAGQLTPIDYGDVCVNIDDAWFASKKINPPTTLDDLIKPEYKNLFVTPGASTSSPGMAFLLATIAAKGEGWKDYWTALMANGTKVTEGWTDAYSVDFSAGEGKGTRPIVLSYASSPPFTIPEGGDKPTTAALLDTCFRQVEYAGVLTGAKNPNGAKAFIQYLLSPSYQASIPDAMYVFPVDSATKLPPVWAKWAEVADKPYTLDPAEIEKNSTAWLTEWTDIASR